MEETKNKLKAELIKLYQEGTDLLLDELDKKGQKVPGRKQDDKKKETSLHMDYQGWYSKALRVVQQALPDRYKEFCEQYKIEKRKEIDFLTYTISDYILGLQVTRGVYKEEVVNPLVAFSSKFQLQLTILYSAVERIDSILSDIEGVLQAELFDGELHSAEDLLKKKHIRSAGALAGVTLEVHLSKVCANHGIKFRKKSPTISDFNEELKKQNVIDVPTWRLIQRLGDIRNMSVHAKEREPRIDEVEDLIVGTRKIVSSIF